MHNYSTLMRKTGIYINSASLICAGEKVCMTPPSLCDTSPKAGEEEINYVMPHFCTL